MIWRRRSQAGFAVVDLETTGLEASSERVVECAIVCCDPTGRPEEEWSSLVAPPLERAIGAEAIHGISRGMLADAPAFGEVAGALAARLVGRIVVGHVLAFDLAHLEAEYARAGWHLPNLRACGLCTRDLARSHLHLESRTLEHCCRHAGIALTGRHRALDDARATAALLAYFLGSTFVPTRALARRARRATWPAIPSEATPLPRLLEAEGTR